MKKFHPCFPGLAGGPCGSTGIALDRRLRGVAIWPGAVCCWMGDVSMKLLRYGPAGQEKPGLLDRDGKIRDL